jgi:hypothetical protein
MFRESQPGRIRRDRSPPAGRRALALAFVAWLLAACATPQMEAQWRDPQAGAKSLHGRSVLVLCRGLDMTLERICEDRLAADLQAIGVRVVRLEPPRDPGADPAAGDGLLKAARAAQAGAILSMRLERYAALPPSGSSVGVGVGGASGGWGSRSGGAIGITLPIGGAGPALASGASLTDAATGRLLWSSRARGSGAVTEAEQIGELSVLATKAIEATGLF